MPLIDNKLTIFAVQMRASMRFHAFRPKPNRMRYRSFVYLLTMVFLTSVFSSCWDNFEEMSFSSANVKRFYFKQQSSCIGIQYYVFYVDQKNGLIFNADSLPYGRVVNHLIPEMEFYSTNGNIFLNDTLFSERDTLDFTQPVMLKNTSADGAYNRTYTVRVNVHQVDPTQLVVTNIQAAIPDDSTRNNSFRMSDGSFRIYFPLANGGLSAYQSDVTHSSWSALTVSGLGSAMNVASMQLHDSKWYATDNAGLLYVSTDGLTWSVQPTSLHIVTLYGSMTSKDLFDVNDNYLIGLSKDNAGAIHGIRSADGVTWEVGAALNEDFPESEYGSITWKSVTNRQYVSVMTGLRADGSFSSSAWATEDGLYWVLVAQSSTLPIANRKGANLFYYEEQLVCYGGVTSSGANVTKVHISKDRGKTWITAPENWIIPAMETGDAYGSILVERVADTVNDKDRVFVWRLGGLSGGEISHSLWKAFEYQALFDRR